MVWGAVFGGVIGPGIGGFGLALVAITRSIGPPDFRQPLEFALGGIVCFGIAGAVIGSAGGLFLQRMKTGYRALVGAVMGVATYTVTLVGFGIVSRSSMWSPTPASVWFLIVISGMICGVLFPHQKLNNRPTPSL